MALSGLSGLSGIFSSAITYLLRDLFTTAQSAPVTTPRTCEPGPGSLVLVQTDGQLSISSSTLVFPAQATPVYGDQGWYMSGGLARVCGRALIGTVNLTARSNAFLLGFNRTGKVGTAFADCAELIFLSGSTTLGVAHNARTSLAVSLGALFSADGVYDLAIMLRSGGQAQYGTLRGGALYLIRGGAVGSVWTLIWATAGDVTTPLYPANSNYQCTGSWSSLAAYDLSGAFTNHYGNARYLAQPADGQNLNAPASDGLWEVTWMPAASEVLDFSVRRTDDANRWIVRCDQAAGNIKLFERNAGVETQRGSTGSQTWTAGGAYRIVVTASGTTLEVRTEDVAAASVTVLKTSYASATFQQTAAGVAVSGTNRVRDLALWPRVLAPDGGASYADLAAVGAITLRSPKPYQVVQRGASTTTLTITGNHNLSGTRTIEARWSGGAWTAIATGVSAGAFSGSLTGLSAGQGTLDVRIADATSITATAASVGIGDVFVIAGQSNAQGQGTNAQAYTGTAGLFHLLGIDYVYKTGADPVGSTANSVDSALNTSGGNSLWPLVATSFVTSQGVPIMMLPAAQGGSAIAAWQPGTSHTDRSTLYGQMIQRATQQPNGIKAVLWWQGEADASAGQTQAYYYGQLSSLATALHTDLGVKLMPCKLQNCSGITAPKQAAINAAIGQAWGDISTTLTGPDLSGIPTDDVFHLMTDAHLASGAALWWAALQAAFGYA